MSDHRKQGKKGEVMKSRWFATSLAAIIVVGAIGYYSAAAKAKTEPVNGTIVGEVIDISDYAMYGRRGSEHAQSGSYRAEKGFPVAILEEETGEVWVAVYRLPVPAAGLQTANSVLGPLMGKQVVAQGLLYRAPGVNLIRIALVREM